MRHSSWDQARARNAFKAARFLTLRSKDLGLVQLRALRVLNAAFEHVAWPRGRGTHEAAHRVWRRKGETIMNLLTEKMLVQLLVNGRTNLRRRENDQEDLDFKPVEDLFVRAGRSGAGDGR